jgi:HPt (histidine-containing phosphotransfer) domain-containing protein
MSESVIDAAAIEKLQKLGGDPLVSEMIALFLRDTPERIAAISNGLKENDLRTVFKAIHPLSSGAGNIGAVKMFEIAGKLEAAAKDSQCDGVKRLLPELEAEYARVKDSLEKLRPR